MKKIIALLIILSIMPVTLAYNAEREEVNGTVNQSQLRQQISNAVQVRNQTILRINQTRISVNSSELIVNATQEQKQLRISNQEVVVDGLEVVNASFQARVMINARINTLEGARNINIVREQNRVQLMEQGSDTMVQLALNNQLRLQDDQLILNASDQERVITILPTQAMNQVRATNQTCQSIELVMEQEQAVYRINEIKQVRLFWFIPLWMDVSSSVDATNGELVSVRKPWWSFLVVE